MQKSLLRALKATAIVAAIADAAERWVDADFPPRVRVATAAGQRLGYSGPVIDYALDRLFAEITRDSLKAVICDELGSLAALDGPVRRPGRPAGFARGVDRVAIVASDTTLGVAIPAAVFALCAKCDVVVKDRSDALVEAFFASLAQERPEFAAAACARSWTGGEDASEVELLGSADVVVAFGGDTALHAIRTSMRADARFVPYGRRASIGFVDAAAGGAGRDALLDAIATDALLYDGQGCLSLHALFVAGDAAVAAEVAAGLTRAFERVGVEFPPGTLDAQRAATAAAFRNLAAFRASNGRGVVYGGRDGTTIVLDPPFAEPPPFLPRTLPVFSVEGPHDVVAYVRHHRLTIAALGIAAGADAADVALAAALGAVRIARFGTLQAPPLTGRHGGAPRIADFVRWIDIE